jgi:hypothetical protein
MIRDRPSKRVLFLIRAYNDLDHIAPVVWKMVSTGSEVAYLLTADEFPGDYRIDFFETVGAIRLKSKTIEAYYKGLRNKLGPRPVRSLVDWIVALSFGRLFLRQHRIRCVVVEWGGADGRARAPFFLRAARLTGLPTLSIPHGYHTWLENDFNEATEATIRETGRLPQFPDRNRFTRYVVQSENIKRYCVESGIKKEKIDILGSARFCKEWSELNQSMCAVNNNSSRTIRCDDHKLAVLFFLNHWNYNVDRGRCLNLLKLISREKNVKLIVKGHTRGKESGGLSLSEEKAIDSFGNVSYPDDQVHSPYLVEQSDIVIVYGSSICFEALRQEKPVCLPKFVCPNPTIFDQSGLVSIADNEDQVIEVIRTAAKGRQAMPDKKKLEKFFYAHVEGASGTTPVLERYSNLISSFLKN